MRSVSTGSYCIIGVGQNRDTGIVERISTNAAGQTVYWLNGQAYSDPDFFWTLGPFSQGDSVWVRADNGTARLARVIEIWRGLFTGRAVAKIQIWECPGWSEPVHVGCDRLSPSSFREDISSDRALVRCAS